MVRWTIVVPRHFARRAMLLWVLGPLVSSCGTLLDPESYPHAPPPPAPPSTTAPRYAAFVRGRPDSVVFDAIDPNGDSVTSVTLDASAFPIGNRPALRTGHVPGSARFRCVLLWSAQAVDTVLYRAIFTARNDLRGEPDTTRVYTVGHATDAAPVVTCPDTLHLTVGVPRSFEVRAADPDGDPVFEVWPGEPLSTSTLLPFNVLSWEQGSRGVGTLRIRGNRAGIFMVRFVAINAARGFATTELIVDGS